MTPSSSSSSSFAKDVVKIVTGTTFAQVITVLASPLITRLYGPEAFGLLALFISINNIIGVIACMRYEVAIMLPKDDREAANLLNLSLLCVVIVSGLTVPVLYFWGDALLSLIKAPSLAPYLILIPPFVLINGIFLALNYWNSRTRHFGRLSIAQITNSLTTTGMQLGEGLAGNTTGGSLVYARLVGSSVTTIVLGGQIWREDHVLLRTSISWKGMLEGLKRYKNFPLIDSGSALLNMISWQLPAFLLAAFFSPTVVGFYSLGLMIIQTPMNLVGGAIGQVFFQRASVAYNDGNLAPLVETVFDVLLTLSLFPMLLLAVAGEDLFLVVFGEAWGEAGVYAQILSIWAIFWFLFSPLDTILSLREKLTLGLNWNILNFSTRLLSLVIGGLMGSIMVAIALFSVSGTFVYGIACFIILKLAGIPPEKTSILIIRHFLVAALFTIPVIFMRYYTSSSLLVVLSAALVFFGYYLYVYLKEPQISNLIGIAKLK